MGSFHARHFDQFEDVAFVAVADITPARRESALKDYPGIRVYEDYVQMLAKEQPDIVTVALPNFLHKEVTIKALQAGSHVLCEKPMAMTVPEALEMRQAALDAGRILGINLSQLFNPTTDTLRNWVAGGQLGEVYHGFVSWTRQNGIPGFGGWFGQKDKSGGGPLIDLGVHRLALALHVLGNPQPVRVAGFTGHHFGVPRARKEGMAFDVEDFASASIRFENGASLFLEVSWDGFQRGQDELEFRFHGTKGTIRREADGLHWCYSKVQHSYVRSEIVIPEDKHASSYRSFVDTVRNGTPFIGSPELGIHLQQILNALYESAASGCEVAIDVAPLN